METAAGLKTRGAVARAVQALVAWVAAASAVAFAFAAWDKRQARRGGGRVRERTLLLLAAAGGSPGLVLAMLVARHKTRKAGFLLPLALILALQLAALYALARWG